MRFNLRFHPSLCVHATLCVAILFGCTPNNPYRADEKYKNIFYTTFDEPPKHLDPARSYSSNEYDVIGQVLEPPLEYHYLKRPYTLTPLSSEGMPEVVYLDGSGKRLAHDASPERVWRAVYTIRIKKGIMFQNHPAFAKDASGTALYGNLTEKDLTGIEEIRDFKYTGSRELIADDFIYQIRRLADPRLECPILPVLEKYMLGFKEYGEALRKNIEAKRRDAGGRWTVDGTGREIMPDYKKYNIAGVEKVDAYTFRVILKRKYPQFIYWLAMPFFSAVPEEAALFYSQRVLEEKNITIDRFPVGTGPFSLDSYRPEKEIALVRNENFHREAYPEEGEPGDKENGLLLDRGKTLPFLERIVFTLEKEAIPRWNKFLQGYYDLSGITSDSFDQAITLSGGGMATLTDFMKEKGITLITSVRPATYYMGFNMLDDVVGGYAEEKKKLRQAISIALDYEEYIEIFNNGRGIAAMGPLPPGIFGHLGGREGINPYVYDWDQGRKKPVRKSIEAAKRLLSEAGYPGGRDRFGKPLVITFDNPWTGADSVQMINWYMKKLKLLGIQLENRTTDYNRFQEKMLKGNFQFFAWGWNADYPDPENFFFLLVGANGKVKYRGENAANYENHEFDRLFRLMENMDNGPERLGIIKNMTRTLGEDSPWVWGFHPVSFTLAHQWIHNLKANSMANNTMKYVKTSPENRAAKRDEWNRPVVWPIAAFAALALIASLPALAAAKRRLGQKGR
ncbi:MAG: ABC transporter substrate-binding protein [Deltaproteobacteria bacterium]|nr:ABC transporter substrate-binding protein [Deltaproteobacteria bacterium]